MGRNVCWKFIREKTRASTVLEVIVSLTICLILFSIVMRFILNMNINHSVEIRQKAELLLAEPAFAGDSTSGMNSASFSPSLILKADTLPVDAWPELRLVRHTVKHFGGKTIRQVSFYIRPSKKTE